VAAIGWSVRGGTIADSREFRWTGTIAAKCLVLVAGVFSRFRCPGAKPLLGSLGKQVSAKIIGDGYRMQLLTKAIQGSSPSVQGSRTRAFLSLWRLCVADSRDHGKFRMSWKVWYDSLEKPSWTPEPSTIGMIWQIIYPIIFVTFGFVFLQAFRKTIPWTVALPFGINLAANLIFTPIQFGLRSLPLAAIDILIVWGTIIWMMVAIWNHYRWVAVAQMPYFLWLSIASVLQLSITFWNPGR
jgi:tryptophan-rich sensory protein